MYQECTRLSNIQYTEYQYFQLTDDKSTDASGRSLQQVKVSHPEQCYQSMHNVYTCISVEEKSYFFTYEYW